MTRTRPLTLLLASCLSVGALTQETLALQPPSVPSAILDAFNTSVDGRLAHGFPFAVPCSDLNVDSSDSPSCHDIQSGYLDEEFRSNVFGAYINPQWETCQTTGEQCLLNSQDLTNLAPVLPPNHCTSGSVPSYYVDVQSESDVQAAFEFSRQTQIPLVIKNTGHDYAGRSSGPNSLALWTHKLKNISYAADFVPEGCSADQAKPGLIIGAGIQWYEAYAFAEANNITVVGGNDRSVGASGGWLQGGGHGMLTNTMGLGVDRVLQFKVVTPDGQYRIANECQNQDLFFALRGGGGGTFGVVLESTILASPQVSLHVFLVSLPTSATGKTDTALTKELWTIMTENGIKWASEGWGGAATSQTVIYIVRGDLMSSEEASESMAPLIEFGKRLQNQNSTGTGAQVVNADFPSWGTFFEWFTNANVASVATSLAIASRLVPRANFETASTRETLVDALLNASSISDNLLFLIDTPFSYPGPHEQTSVTEAWRDSIYHITTVSTWKWNSTKEEKINGYRTAAQSIDYLRAITPDAAYQNEADVYEPNHEVSFWGSNYDRLLTIKEKYDPDRLLDCWHCVGWKKQATQFSCYFSGI